MNSGQTVFRQLMQFIPRHDFNQCVYRDLCLTLFPWAEFRRTKAAVKMHTLIDLRGTIPTYVTVTTGKVHDVRMLDTLPVTDLCDVRIKINQSQI